MRKLAFVIPLAVVMLTLSPVQKIWAQEEPAYYDESYDEPEDSYQGDRYDEAAPPLLAPQELEDLLGPIALYPDPLIAQILPAATFIDQIDEAARYVRQYGSSARVDDKPWDISVRAVAHYPDVLFMMDEKYDWTVALGQAYIEQPQDVMDAIQRLRAQAQENGNLYTTPQQQVYADESAIRIVPATPQYIYVPVYDPQVIYIERYTPIYPFITFSTGFFIGAWLNRDCDWHRHRVYYHGWRERGWVGRARPHIHDRRGIYINRRARVIRTNDRILQHDTRQFRHRLWEDTSRRMERRGLPAPPPPSTRPRTRNDQQRHQTGKGRTPAARGTAPAVGPGRTPAGAGRTPATTRRSPSGTVRRPGAGRTPATPAPAPGTVAPSTRAPRGAQPPAGEQRQPSTSGRGDRSSTRDVYRGRDVERRQPASQTDYGGYGSSRDATIYRERGQSSREGMRHGGAAGGRTSTPTIHVPRPVSPPSPNPAPRPVTPAPRSVPASPSMRAPAAAPAPVIRPAPPMSRPSPAPMHSPAPGGMPSSPAPAMPGRR